MSVLRIETSDDCYIGFGDLYHPPPSNKSDMIKLHRGVTFFATDDAPSLVASPWRNLRSYKFVQID